MGHGLASVVDAVTVTIMPCGRHRRLAPIVDTISVAIVGHGLAAIVDTISVAIHALTAVVDAVAVAVSRNSRRVRRIRISARPVG
ncbi:hypothetical protein [Agromyces sp. NPDC049794]|uniref:hypothetical protein n=1 Tax=unclassified Agromyces TaxID=2639701 RepID=UPI00340A9B96